MSEANGKKCELKMPLKKSPHRKPRAGHLPASSGHRDPPSDPEDSHGDCPQDATESHLLPEHTAP